MAPLARRGATEATELIVTFLFPTPANESHHRTGGLVVLYQFANGLARLGHEVHFLHGPKWPDRIDRLEQLPPFPFEDDVHHHIFDSLDDAGLPEADVIFNHHPPEHLGLPAVIVQGFRMLPREWERDAFRVRAPKYCVASWLIDIGLRFGVPREQLFHVPLGMDHDLFRVRTPVEERTIDVATIFNGHHQKGWKVGLAAMHEISRRRPGVNGVVFGMLEPAEALPPGFRFVEAPDHLTLATDIYNEAKIYVQPSYHEGFGYPAVEAMACGAALVTTDNGGSRDYAVADETAWVVPPGDSTGLADGVEALLEADPTRCAIARRGADLVRKFDWDLGSARLATYLEQYVADPDRFRRAPGPYVEWYDELEVSG